VYLDDGRVGLADAFAAGTVFGGAHRGRRWNLRVDAAGRHGLDRRGRLLVPLGVRLLLRLDDQVLVWWRDDRLVVCSA
jgi:hypothetical protein